MLAFEFSKFIRVQSLKRSLCISSFPKISEKPKSQKNRNRVHSTWNESGEKYDNNLI